MKFTLTLLLLVCLHNSFSQKLKKADKLVISNIQAHISYLASDKLEGRRTGTEGEKLASEYIISEFKKIGLTPSGDKGDFLQEFQVNEGKVIDPTSHLIINGNDLKVNKDYFPLASTANVTLEALPIPALSEPGQPWFFDLKDLLVKNTSNPHYDIMDGIRAKVTEVMGKRATALLIYNSSNIDDGLNFDGKAKPEYTKIPVIYITKEGKKNFFSDDQASYDLKLKVNIKDKIRYGHNVIGFVDNHAANTIIIGAHYDHLGYGEDHNSLNTGTPAIHNGADDNASGTAGVIELARMLKTTGSRQNNYLFISFSGEELGLFGSKHFTLHPTIDLSKVNYMINLDMVGRLNDTTKAITVGGYGTSPVWGNLISAKTKSALVIKPDSSGTGPSDHTSFYRKDIPVLFFFTGTHSDYHKPTDDVEKINFTGEYLILQYIYKLIDETSKMGKLAFTKTREQQMGSTKFTVSLGIMPDYTFSGTGVRVDGVSEGKLAQKIGLKAGDIVEQLGEYKFNDVMSYMGVLSKFKKGDATKLKVKRGNEELMFDIVFQ